MYILHILIFIWNENVKKSEEDTADYINWYEKTVSLGIFAAKFKVKKGTKNKTEVLHLGFHIFHPLALW